MKIEFNHVEKNWGNTKTLNDISFTIDDGDFVAILGPSGCGKSTSLMLMAGIYECSSGEICFDGKVMNNVPARNRNLSVVFQSYALYPHKTVLDNILFPLKYIKPAIPADKALNMAQEVAEKVQVDHLLQRMPSELSGGQQQRVALARGLIKSPKLLLLDEPLSNLDATLRHSMREELKKLQLELGITTVMVTHDQLEAMTMANKVIVMNHGVLEQVGTPDDVYLRPKTRFVAEFIGSPSINLLSGTINDQSLVVRQGHITLRNPLGKEVKDVQVGIRPEGVLISQTGYKGIVNDAYIVGREWMLRLSTEFGELRVIGPTHCNHFSVGDTVNFEFASEHVHLFCSETGERHCSLMELGDNAIKAA